MCVYIGIKGVIVRICKFDFKANLEHTVSNNLTFVREV